MRYSKLLVPTTREVPAEAEVASHRLMIRAGFIRKVSSGTYTYLPLGWRSLRKIVQIIRQEMDAAGAQEILMPAVQPMELWQRTGRDKDYGETMCHFTDRHGRQNVLAPTAEEVVTSLVAGEVSSYRQLPLNLYQISFKFRDEFRPRFGVLRSREFLMKDAYSFDADAEGLEATYQKMYQAYCRIFGRCGLPYVIVEAESGEMGGSGSQQYTVPCESGEDVIVQTEDGSYAASGQKAPVDPLARSQAAGDVPAMQDVHTPGVGSIEAVCAFLGTRPEEMVKTLVYWQGEKELIGKYESVAQTVSEKFEGFFALNEAIWAKYGQWANQAEYAERLLEAMEAEPKLTAAKLDPLLMGVKEYYDAAAAVSRCATVALVRGDHELNEEKLRAAAGKSVALASESVIRAVTRAAVGFAGPVGLAGGVDRFIIDHAVAAMAVGVTGANKTDYHTRNVVPGRDFPLDGPNVVVADIRTAVEGDTYQGKKLIFRRGIEVGQIFKLGTKYSKGLGAVFLDAGGEERPCVMGCYGVGVNRILAAAIETGHDENGCILPVSIAPFEIEVLAVNSDNAQVRAEAERIYGELHAAGADVLLDDRDARPGVKFKDADLIGIPLRIVVGERGLKAGKVEIQRRSGPEPVLVEAGQAVAEALRLVQEMKRQVL